MNNWPYHVSAHYTIRHGDDHYQSWTGHISAVMVDVVDRRDFLSRLDSYGARTSLRTHPTTKHSQAEFIGEMHGNPATFHVSWFPPKEPHP